MKEKIEHFAKGEFEYNMPKVVLSENNITILAEINKVYKGSFVVKNELNRQMKGIVYSSDRHFKIITSKFLGIENEIKYEFYTDDLQSDDIYSGIIDIITDHGEVELPFKVEILHYYYNTSVGKVKDLNQFTELAKADWSEALNIFVSKDFKNLLLENDKRILMIYEGLIESASKSQAMEEFLISLRKKMRINVAVEKTNFEYIVKKEAFKDKITIVKDHWGYVEFHVSSDCDFIIPEYEIISSEQFIGNSYDLQFIIKPEFMRQGNNFGRLYIKNVYQNIIIDFICKKEKVSILDNNIYIQIKSCEMSVIVNYLNFRLESISKDTYISQIEAITNLLSSLIFDYKYELLKTHLYIISNESEKAVQKLSFFESKKNELKDNPLIYCGYLYLNALYNRNEDTINEAVKIINEYYNDKNNRDFRILWYLFYLDKKYDENIAYKLRLIKEQFENGCTSPIMYYEAACIFNMDSTLMAELGRFELQVLNWAIQNNFTNDDVAIHFVYLAGKEKYFNSVIFRSLTKLYSRYHSKDILSAICSILIKGHKTNIKYFKWYKLGVDAQLKITELHEYYMYAFDENLKIKPLDTILMYFIYNSNLSDKKKAYLYAYIIKNKENNQNLYRSYLKSMQRFAIKQLELKRISENLAVIYNEFINNDIINESLANSLSELIFKYQIICLNENIKGIFVKHDELKKEEFVPLINNRAYIDILTEDVEIFLVDKYNNRYNSTIEYMVSGLLKSDNYIERCYEFCPDNEKSLIYLAQKSQIYQKIDDTTIEIRKKAIELSNLKDTYKEQYIQTLIMYYYDNFENELLEKYLLKVNMNSINKRERINIIEFMIVRELNSQAEELIKKFGYEGIPKKKLLLFITKKIEEMEILKYDSFIMNICFYVFESGRHNETILNYMAQFFVGTTKNMYMVWDYAKRGNIDILDLEEKLLAQMLFAENYINKSFEVFFSYYKKGNNRKLIRAFITYNSYKYLISNTVIRAEFFEIMKKELIREDNETCLLAILKYYCYSKEYFDEIDITFLEVNINRCIEKNLILPFFKDFGNRIKIPAYIRNKYYVQYIGERNQRVYIHYLLHNKTKDVPEYIVEPLREVFMGIYVKDFVLFNKEYLRYYITQVNGTKEIITQSDDISFQNTEEDNSNYSKINMMITAQHMKDDKTLINLMDKYIKAKYIAENLFEII